MTKLAKDALSRFVLLRVQDATINTNNVKMHLKSTNCSLSNTAYARMDILNKFSACVLNLTRLEYSPGGNLRDFDITARITASVAKLEPDAFEAWFSKSCPDMRIVMFGASELGHTTVVTNFKQRMP